MLIRKILGSPYDSNKDQKCIFFSECVYPIKLLLRGYGFINFLSNIFSLSKIWISDKKLIFWALFLGLASTQFFNLNYKYLYVFYSMYYYGNKCIAVKLSRIERFLFKRDRKKTTTREHIFIIRLSKFVQ